MDKPKTMLFQDGGTSLCLSMEDIGPGWKSKPQADYQVCIHVHMWHIQQNGDVSNSSVIERVSPFKIMLIIFTLFMFVSNTWYFRGCIYPIFRYLLVLMNILHIISTDRVKEERKL